MNAKLIEKKIIEFIAENYGSDEADDPCYNIKAMVKYNKRSIT